MNKIIKPKKYLIASLVFVAVGFISALTVVLTFGNNDQLQAAATNQVVEVNLHKSEVLPATVTLSVGQKMRINNKSNVARELSLGSGSAHGDNKSHEDDAPHNDEQHDNHEAQAHEHTSGFSTGSFEPDEAWEGSFDQPGTYFMHDHENPDINILVVVYYEE